MTEGGLHPPGLYDSQCQCVGGSPALSGPRQEWVAIWPLGQVWDGTPALTWLAPVGQFRSMPGVVVAHLVAAVDAGHSVIMWGSCPVCVAEAGQIITRLIGGGHA